MSFWESLGKIFNLFPRQKSYDELTGELDNKMQDFYTKMGWGEYKKSYPMSGWNYATDINRVLEAEKQFNNAVDDYIYWSKRTGAARKEYNPIVKDPARRRINKYYDRQQFK